MAIATAFMFTALTSSDYGPGNDLIGQYKTLILQDSKWTVISDNNPAASVSRELVLQYGNCMHYLKLKASSNSTAITKSIRNLANTADINSYYNYPATNNSLTVAMQYGSNSCLIDKLWSGTITGFAVTIGVSYFFLRGSDGNDYAGYVSSAYTGGQILIFASNSDTTLNLSYPEYPLYTVQNKIVMGLVYAYTGSTGVCTFTSLRSSPYFVWPGLTYNDGTNNYFALCAGNAYGMAIIDN